MKLDDRQKALRDAALAEAHQGATGGVPTRGIALRFVDALRDTERFGEAWVDSYLRHLAVSGAMKVCADWRRPQRTAGQTARGTAVDVPRYVGERTEEGWETRDSGGMTADELRTLRARLEAQRNTLSKRIAHLNDALKLLDSGDARTFAEAVDALAVAS